MVYCDYAVAQKIYSAYSMLTIVVHTLIIPLSIVLTGLVACVPMFWPMLLAYAFLIHADTTPENGSSFTPSQIWFRGSSWWKAFANYYPVTLHKTVDLEPSSAPIVQNGVWSSLTSLSMSDTPLWFVIWPFLLVAEAVRRISGKPPSQLPPSKGRKYLFAACPHGIISMGAFSAIGTEGANWSSLFPGVLTHLLTISSNFYFPFYRQYLMALGIASVSKRSCINLLNNNQNICIVVGGARESLLAEPDRFDVILNCRKGFIKVALITGATVVPVISFGENNIYKQVRFKEGSWGDYILNWLAHNVGFTLPLFHARGIFDKNSGLIAYNRPINVVVGRPIEVPLVENPDQKTIDEFHGIYLRELKQLYAENVNKYTPGVELNIVA